MKLTKLVHACLLVESKEKRFLVDPGNYSWASGLVQPNHLTNIDAVVVTHAHPDHLHEDFVRAIVKASPDVTWYGPQQVVDQLAAWDIKGVTSSSDDNIKFIESRHADLSPWFEQQPDHTSFVVLDELLVGGDCHTLTESHGARIFGAAINGGPWGAVVGFSKMIESMTDRPQIVVPLHDWHWNDEARQGIYGKLPDVMNNFGVTFVGLENGVSQEL